MLHIIRYLLHKKPNKGGSVSSLTRASPAAAVDALDDLALLELGLGHAADAVGGEVGVARLDAAQAAEVLVALLLPLGDQVLVGDLVLHAVVVQLSADGLPLVEEVEDVPGPLMVDLEDWPQCLHLSLALVRLRLGLPHLALQLLQGGLDQLPALGRRLAPGPGRAESHFRHL